MTTSSLLLAVDVGASRTAAAVARIGPDGTAVPLPFLLGRHTDSVPSAIFVGDGELLFGDAAVRRGLVQPERLIRDFKRRIGDGTPIIAGDRRFSPEQLFALLVQWVADSVMEREGQRPASLGVTIPATWSDHRSGLVARALERSGWPNVRFVSEPEAAARHYAAERSLEAGLLAVYDLGGGTFDAALVRIDASGELELVGEAVGLDAFGGSDFDDAVLRHVIGAAGLAIDRLQGDEDARLALAVLRREAVEAKEALSFDSETAIPILVGDGRTTVRLTRSEFEGMIEDGIGRTADVLADLIDAAGSPDAEVTAILLTGGSSRIPRIAQLLSERFDCPVAVDADPKSVISLGAARGMVDADRATETRGEPPTDEVADAEGDDEAPAFARPGPKHSLFGRAATIAAVVAGALMLSIGITVTILLPDSEARSDTTVPAPSTTPSSSEVSTAPTPSPTPVPVPVSSSEPLLTPAPGGVVTDVFPPRGDEALLPQPNVRGLERR